MAENSHHLTDEQFAEIAVEGSTGDPQHGVHLAECASCRAAVERMTRLTGVLSEPVEILAPPPSLWNKVEESVRTSPAEDFSRHRHRHRGGDRERGRGRHVARRRKAAWGAALAGLLAGTVLGGAAVVATGNLREDPDDTPTQTVVAVGAANLEPVGQSNMHGEAVMERNQDGQLELHVDVSDIAQDGYLEVWLRDEEATRLVSLGVATSHSTTVDVPDGLDLEQFPVVDVSHEHFDGDPAHSGDTLLAGTMESTDA